jgi:hypothetical protein
MVAVDNSSAFFRQSYAKGLPLFIYGLTWLVGLLAAYLWLDRFLIAAPGLPGALLTATWSAGLAGAMGGATALLSRLYQHVSVKQDFQRQSLLIYLIQPVTGLIAGLLSLYLLSIPGALILNFVTELDIFLNNLSLETILPGLSSLISGVVANLAVVSTTSTFIAIQILVAWMAGFYQQVGFRKLKAIGQRLMAGPESAPLFPEKLDENEPLFFKRWVEQRRQMVRWSYTWGLFLIIYGIAWLIGLFGLYLLSRGWSSSQAATNMILAALPAGLAGGCGGVFSLLYDLYRHVSIKQDFHRQHLMAYLVQPVIGFVFGLVMDWFVAAGYLSLQSMFDPAGAPPVVDAPTLIMIQLSLGWIAGFRQQAVTEIIQRVVEGVFALAKAVVAFFNPANLFNQSRRQEQAVEISEELGLFEALQRERESSTNRS